MMKTSTAIDRLGAGLHLLRAGLHQCWSSSVLVIISADYHQSCSLRMRDDRPLSARASSSEVTLLKSSNSLF
jgi:hypothetical protein